MEKIKHIKGDLQTLRKIKDNLKDNKVYFCPEANTWQGVFLWAITAAICVKKS